MRLRGTGAAFAGHDSEDDSMKTPAPSTIIDTWVFDLDNTLLSAPRQPVAAGRRADRRTHRRVSRRSRQEARVIQKDYYRRYGITMRGTMTEHGTRRRLPSLGAPDRSFAAEAKPLDGRGDLRDFPAASRADQRLTDHAGAALERLGIPSLSRRCSTSSPPNLAGAGACRPTTSSCAPRRRSSNNGDVRGLPARNLASALFRCWWPGSRGRTRKASAASIMSQ